jgi:signal transduction histidine kinase/CheY-like chemotaxis protein
VGSERILVWAPSGRDANLASSLLAHHGLEAVTCDNIDALTDQLLDAGCAVITAEALDRSGQERLREALAAQPAWSDFPIILFAPRGVDRVTDADEATKLLGNVTILERPVLGRTLLSAVTAALRGRRRQYEGREAIHRRDEFLAMLGHELRNPLAAILLASESLDVVAGEVGGKQRKIIDRQARHLARLVDDLLDVSRVTSGKISLQSAPVDVGEVIQRCLQGAELAARQRRIQLRSNVGMIPLVVHGDLVRLEEVFNNLVGNALKYSPEGARVDVSARHEDGTCIVEVIDTGIGIAPDMLERVFDLFAQVDTTLDRAQGGLGIGLTLARSLVELHGGTIEVSSKGLGCGSRFTVRLPELREDPRRSAAPLALVPETSARRIVLVEDNADLLEVTTDLLEALGHTVTGAADGAGGIAAIVAERPDVALIDIGLPGIDGYTIAREVRKQLVPPPLLVATTGYGQDIDRQRALEAGFDAHLTKPITPDTLARVIARGPVSGPRAGDARAVPDTRRSRS